MASPIAAVTGDPAAAAAAAIPPPAAAAPPGGAAAPITDFVVMALPPGGAAAPAIGVAAAAAEHVPPAVVSDTSSGASDGRASAGTTSSSDSDHDVLPTGKFTGWKLLDCGGNGLVYAAEHEALHDVAIKVLRRGTFGSGVTSSLAEEVGAVVTEVRGIMKALNRAERVVRCHCVVQGPDPLAPHSGEYIVGIVMERYYCSIDNLLHYTHPLHADWVADADMHLVVLQDMVQAVEQLHGIPLTDTDAVEATRAQTAALAGAGVADAARPHGFVAARTSHLVHGDLKAANVLLRASDATAAICDFGHRVILYHIASPLPDRKAASHLVSAAGGEGGDGSSHLLQHGIMHSIDGGHFRVDGDPAAAAAGGSPAGLSPARGSGGAPEIAVLAPSPESPAMRGGAGAMAASPATTTLRESTHLGITGTAEWNAPELHAATLPGSPRQGPTAATDMFALGSTCFQVLAKTRELYTPDQLAVYGVPLNRDDPTYRDRLRAAVCDGGSGHVPLRPALERLPGIPPVLAVALKRTWSSVAAERGTPGDLLKAVNEVIAARATLTGMSPAAWIHAVRSRWVVRIGLQHEAERHAYVSPLAAMAPTTLFTHEAPAAAATPAAALAPTPAPTIRASPPAISGPRQLYGSEVVLPHHRSIIGGPGGGGPGGGAAGGGGGVAIAPVPAATPMAAAGLAPLGRTGAPPPAPAPTSSGFLRGKDDADKLDG